MNGYLKCKLALYSVQNGCKSSTSVRSSLLHRVISEARSMYWCMYYRAARCVHSATDIATHIEVSDSWLDNQFPHLSAILRDSPSDQLLQFKLWVDSPHHTLCWNTCVVSVCVHLPLPSFAYNHYIHYILYIQYVYTVYTNVDYIRNYLKTQVCTVPVKRFKV